MIEVYLIPIAYFFLSYVLFRFSLHAKSVATFASRNVEDIKASMILLSAFGALDAYLAIVAFVYFSNILTEAEALTYAFIGLATSLVVAIIALTKIQYRGIISEVLISVIVVGYLLLLVNFAVNTDPIAQRNMASTYGLIVTLMGAVIIITFIVSKLKNIRSNDVFLKASGFGGAIATFGFVMTIVFFFLNRLYGSLFGPLALLAQASLAVAAIGIYMSISPPTVLINFAEEKIKREKSG